MTDRFASSAGSEPAEQWLGVYHAKVTNDSDPLAASRVKLYIPQVLGAAESNWARPLGFIGGVPPVTGTVVYAMFLGGDIARPLYFPGNVQP